MLRGDARRPRRAVPIVAIGVLCLAAPALAERAWVKDEVTIYLRTGPGNQYRILSPLKTGDDVQIVSRGDGWTQVRHTDREGWIPAGFLQPRPPARVELERRESETATIRQQLEEISRSEGVLKEENSKLASRDEEQRAEITRLTRENLELRAGARWPEWITGALILSTGMVLGAILSRISGRGRRQRIRL